jgi:hypothetical protein
MRTKHSFGFIDVCTCYTHKPELIIIFTSEFGLTAILPYQFLYHIIKLKTKFHGLSPRANYTDRATAACRRSDCQLLRVEGATWSA